MTYVFLHAHKKSEWGISKHFAGHHRNKKGMRSYLMLVLSNLKLTWNNGEKHGNGNQYKYGFDLCSK